MEQIVMAIIFRLTVPVESGARSKEQPKRRDDVKSEETVLGCHTGDGVMVKTLYAVAVAAIAAACFVAFPSLSMQVQASATALSGKSDRADARPLGTQCSQNAWPYFEASCLRDTDNPLGQARQVRIVPLDKMPKG
jgi:hypothetical protein